MGTDRRHCPKVPTHFLHGIAGKRSKYLPRIREQVRKGIPNMRFCNLRIFDTRRECRQ
jgi:hypothetical protein